MTDKAKPKKRRRGHMRFVCGACAFTVNVTPGVTYQGANVALGRAGWRIECRPTPTKSSKDAHTWMPVCNICATPPPPPLPPPLPAFTLGQAP